MALLLGHDAAVAAFVRAVCLEPAVEFGACRGIGALGADGHLVGGIVLHDWQPARGTIEVSGAGIGRGWLTRRFVRWVGAYLFGTVGVQAVVARTSGDNAAAARALRALGFVGHEIPRLRGLHEAEIVFTLTVEDWRAGRFGSIAS